VPRFDSKNEHIRSEPGDSQRGESRDRNNLASDEVGHRGALDDLCRGLEFLITNVDPQLVCGRAGPLIQLSTRHRAYSDA